MKKYILFILVLFLTVSCSKKNRAEVSVTIDDLPDSSVVLYKLNYNYFSLVDTLKTDAEGYCRYNVEMMNNNPAFYYLYTVDNSRKLAAMILLPGDKVSIKTDLSGNYSIDGSEESINLKAIDDALATSITKIGNILSENAADADAQVTKVYVDHKRNMLKHIANHPYSITAATVVFQKLGDNVPVFGEGSDVIIFKSIYDSLKTVYPNSEYLTALLDEIQGRQKAFDLGNASMDADYVGFPEISLPDITGKSISLSETVKNSRTVILSFWTISQTEHKIFNQELTELYLKYKDSGLEIYQVSLDEKPLWAATVKNQNIPWISVNDGWGKISPAVAKYNITDIPTMFVIDRNGNISDRDVYDLDELEKIIRKNLN